MVGAVDDDLAVEVVAEQGDRRVRIVDASADRAWDVVAFERAGSLGVE